MVYNLAAAAQSSGRDAMQQLPCNDTFVQATQASNPSSSKDTSGASELHKRAAQATQAVQASGPKICNDNMDASDTSGASEQHKFVHTINVDYRSPTSSFANAVLSKTHINAIEHVCSYTSTHDDMCVHIIVGCI